jgi:hypothetical protein
MSLKIALKGELRTSCETCNNKGPQPDINSGPSEIDAARAATFEQPLGLKTARDKTKNAETHPNYLGIV